MRELVVSALVLAVSCAATARSDDAESRVTTLPSPESGSRTRTTAEIVRRFRSVARARGISEPTDRSEYGTAGFHLVRPSRHPDSGFESGILHMPRAGYTWFDLAAHDADVTYDTGVPDDWRVPSSFVVVSEARLLENPLGPTRVEAATDGTLQVSVRISSSSVARLRERLLPDAVSVEGGHVDWLSIVHAEYERETEMLFALVAEAEVHLPLSAQDVIAAADGGSTDVVVASGLDRASAERIAERLQVPGKR